jgi:methyl-accepting chemotaxis protein
LITAVNKANKSTKAKMIFMESNTTVEEYQESNTNKFIMLKSNLDNGYTLYIKIATAPIKENIKISNETLALIGVLMVMISATLSSFVSRKFTEPILELNGITKKMANLDFSKRYRITDTDDEINTLGKNIN